MYNSTIAKDSKREPTTNGIFSDEAIKNINEKYLLTSPFNVENISNVIWNNLDVTKMSFYNAFEFSKIVQKNDKNNKGQTLLYVAARSLSPESVKLILNNAEEKISNYHVQLIQMVQHLYMELLGPSFPLRKKIYQLMMN